MPLMLHTIRTHDVLQTYLDVHSDAKLLFFWGHRPRKDGTIGQSCFSQWFPSVFEVNGQVYQNAEQYMMAQKASLFDDQAILAEILLTSDPKEMKALGRKVRGFEQHVWEAARFDIVVEGNRAKFTQNPLMATYLRHTGSQILVEASPVDTIWGIGLSARDVQASDPAQWRGLNLLGYALMAVRAEVQRAL